MDFKENVVISTVSVNGIDESSVKIPQLFKKFDNNSAIIDEKPIYINERLVQNNMLVISVLRNKTESLFVLEEMVDIVQNEGEKPKYYFK